MAHLKSMTRLYRCPETHQTLQELDEETLRMVNEAVRAGTLKNHAGHTVQQIIDGGLMNEDKSFAYPVRDGVANLLLDDRIALFDI